jgi:hypothetical protein
MKPRAARLDGQQRKNGWIDAWHGPLRNVPSKQS